MTDDNYMEGAINNIMELARALGGRPRTELEAVELVDKLANVIVSEPEGLVLERRRLDYPFLLADFHDAIEEE